MLLLQVVLSTTAGPFLYPHLQALLRRALLSNVALLSCGRARNFKTKMRAIPEAKGCTTIRKGRASREGKLVQSSYIQVLSGTAELQGAPRMHSCIIHGRKIERLM